MSSIAFGNLRRFRRMRDGLDVANCRICVNRIDRGARVGLLGGSQMKFYEYEDMYQIFKSCCRRCCARGRT